MLSSILRALLFGVLLSFSDELLTIFLHSRGMSYFDEVLLESALTGLLGGLLILVYAEERRRRATSRMEELAFLNHHIRNALTAINLSSYAKDDTVRLEIVADASRRIEATLKRMSAQEHVSLDPSNGN